MNQEIKKVVETFHAISLHDMDQVSLMNRTDTKFLLATSQLLDVLELLSDDYQVLQIKNNSVMTYKSLYYDTADKDFYKWHHNGKLNRIKIRIRNYVESNIHFLEVKKKNGKGITNKTRIRVNDFENQLSEKSNDFILKTTRQNLFLEPSLQNKFNRITLVSRAHKERVTIDFNLSFNHAKRRKLMQNLAIIEIKQEGLNRNSPIFLALKNKQFRPHNISKYCLGIISLNDGIKYNSFKNQLLKIKKLTA